MKTAPQWLEVRVSQYPFSVPVNISHTASNQFPNNQISKVLPLAFNHVNLEMYIPSKNKTSSLILTATPFSRSY